MRNQILYPLPLLTIISLSLISAGCNKPADKNKQLGSISFSSNTAENAYDFLDEINLDLLKDENDQKLYELSLKYEDYDLKIEKDADDGIQPWKLYATIYINQRPHEIALSDSTLEKLEEQLSHEIISRKSDDIIELEKTFNISIEIIEKNGSQKFKVTDNNSGENDTFQNLNDIKIVYTGIENSSAYIAKKAKTIKYVIRKLRGKDPHNKVINLKTQDAGKALVIDGFDDLASALENSGLPKHLELSLKSSIYMIFGGAVFIGYEGASEEFQETRSEYAESVEETKTLRKEIIANMENEIAAKEVLLSSLETSDNSLNSQAKIAREIAMENAKFKIEFAKEILKAINSKKIQTKLDAKIFTKLLDLVQNHNMKVKEIKTNANVHLKVLNSDHAQLFNKLKSIEKIKSLPVQDQEYVATSLNSLFEYQKGLNDSLSKSIESTSILPNISRGLSSMFYGMVAFEAKTLAELTTLNSNTLAAGSAKALAFENYLFSVEAIGNTFLAAGQAQMVLAGLSKISDNSKELKSLNTWIEEMVKSSFWDEVKASNLDPHSKKNILNTKKILENFYKSKRNWIRMRAMGDTMLTAGQAAMFVSGPLVFGMPALSGFGAGSTILGIVTSQMSDQYIDKNFEFDAPAEDSMEAKIAKGDLDNPNDPLIVKLLDRSTKLVDLSHQKAQVRIWQKIYDTLIINPNVDSKELIRSLKHDWQNKNSKINSAKKAYYSEVYLKNLKKMFPENNPQLFNKNLEFIDQAKLLLNSNTNENSSLKSLNFIKFISTHLRLLNINKEVSNNVYSPVLIEKVKTSSLSNHKIGETITSIFTFFDEFGLAGEFDRRIVKKIVLQNGFPFSTEKSALDKKKIAHRYLKEVVVKTNKQPWNIPNPLPGFFVYYFPQLSGNSDKPSKPLIFSKKDKSVYIFDRKLYLEDLNNYESITQSEKIAVDEFTKLAFEASDYANSIDQTFFAKLKKMKGIFGKELRSVFVLTYEAAAKSIFKANTIRPITDGVVEQLDKYNNINNIAPIKSKKFSKANIAKYSYAGIEKFSHAANKYNVGMNFLLMPQSLSNIHQSVQNGEIADATRGALSFSFNNADLAFDLARTAGGQKFWVKHPKSFQGIGSIQVALNVASAGLDIWQAVELFKAGHATENKSLKTDLYVNASLTTATAATSLGTALLLPLTAKAGPIGTAIGFTIMFSQGTYNAVRTSEQLRELGFSEEYVVMNSIANFFGQYSTGEDPKFIVKKTAKEMEETTIPDIITLNNKEFLENIGKNKLNNSYYFNKIVFPKINLYVPYTHAEISTFCAYGICNSQKTQIPRPIEEDKHMCLTNNSYFSNERDSKDTQMLLGEHLKFINLHHTRLAKKATTIPAAPPSISYGAFGSRNNYNSTMPCPKVYNNYPMIEKYDNPTPENLEKIKNISESQKADLYLVGIGDQGKHGNMISSIMANKNNKNLFNIHPASYILQLVGGDKEDIFEFYNYLQGKTEGSSTNGFIDGGDGIDTINLQGLNGKNEKVYISLNGSTNNQFLEIRNVENVIGSKNDDVIDGNESNNVIFGRDGNDIIKTYAGNDILYPGTGNDELHGGIGSDVYVILKKDVAKGTEKIINNFDHRTNNNFNDYYDAIMTDIENLSTLRDGHDLLLGVYEEDDFVKYIRIKYYFVSDKYKHIGISDLNGNVYTTLNGSLDNSNSNSPDYLSGQNINTINLKGNYPIVRMDEKLQYSARENSNINTFKALYLSGNPENTNKLKKDTFNLEFKNVIGTNGNDVIFGDNQDNFINGQKGIDYLKGNDGDDTLSVLLETKKLENESQNINNVLLNYVNGQQDEFIQLAGDKGHDNYILNLSNLSRVENTKPIFVEINNKDKEEKIDSLIITDTRNTISNIYFTKISSSEDSNQHLKINFFDNVEEKNYVVILKNWFNHSEYQHLQIQVGNKLSIPLSIMNLVTKSLIDSAMTKITGNLLESEKFEFSINDLFLAINQYHFNIFKNTYHIIEYKALRQKENILDFKFEINNDPNVSKIKNKIKFAHLENDLVIQFEANSIQENSSFIVLKDYFKSHEFNSKSFIIKANDVLQVNSEDFQDLVTNLVENDLISLEL
ncbi:calcium-binding protein [Fluviispira vulneris]|uniref:calcium-binding protein n=1 Tax=Fluviispira vulneris TaxID=2763012 RepID=UPI001647C15F|nr:calcium-binding protein [Fluviispira vulneris]